MNVGWSWIQINCDFDALAWFKEYNSNSQNAELLYLIHKTLQSLPNCILEVSCNPQRHIFP